MNLVSEPVLLSLSRRAFHRRGAIDYRKSIMLFLALSSFLVLANDAAGTTMNKCTYPNGRVEFTDQPCSPDFASSVVKNGKTVRPAEQNLISVSKLRGTWIVDPKATERLVLSATPPPNAYKLAEWFGLAGGYWALFTYEFDGDVAVMNAYRGSKKLEFQLLSHQGEEIKYALKGDASSTARTLSVFFAGDGNLKIVPSESPESNYVLWKRGTVNTERTTPDDIMAVSKTWLASIQNIVKYLKETPEKTSERPVSNQKEDPRPALEEAVRSGAIRRATPADAQGWLDADTEKYKRKKLPPPNHSHESSILSGEIAKASAYVVLAEFTYPPGLVGANRAIFLVPRNVPEPKGNYGDSKIYRFYDDHFDGPSVEYKAGSRW